MCRVIIICIKQLLLKTLKATMQSKEFFNIVNNSFKEYENNKLLVNKQSESRVSTRVYLKLDLHKHQVKVTRFYHFFENLKY